MAKNSKQPTKKPAPKAPAPVKKGPAYDLGYMYGQLGNAIKAAHADKGKK